jgi:GT2 family glycosyltransferase
MYSEDADYSERVRRAGFGVVYAPSAKLWHKVSSFSGGGLTPLKVRLKVEHNLIFFRRYASWYHWITIPFVVLAGGVVFSLLQLLRGNFAVVGALLKGFLNGFRSLSRPVEYIDPNRLLGSA